VKRIAFIFIFSTVLTCFAQPGVVLTLSNVNPVGTDFFFDLYLYADSLQGERIYLGESDIHLNFNPAAFNSPGFQKVDNPVPPFGLQNGFNSLQPVLSDNNGAGDVGVQASYHAGIATELRNGDELIINLRSPEAETLLEFRSEIGEIDSLRLTHRLGRFLISGYNGGPAGLSIDAAETEIATYDSLDLSAPVLSQYFIELLPDPLLSVRWLGIEAKLLDHQEVEIRWMTGEEINHDYFVVEKGEAEWGFRDLARVEEGEKEGNFKEYRYVDTEGWGSKARYRIRQVDIDGKFSYSKVVEVNAGYPGELPIRVFPNPVKDLLYVQFFFSEVNFLTYRLLDSRGRKLSGGPLDVEGGKGWLDCSALTPGLYLLEFWDARGRRKTHQMRKIK